MSAGTNYAGQVSQGDQALGEADQARLREGCEQARLRVRESRREVMRSIGTALRSWRAMAGVQQQLLAQHACLSPTVVRRIEKADYESPPPRSLLKAVELLAGPADDLAVFADRYRSLQAEQQRLEQMLGRKVLPSDALVAPREMASAHVASRLIQENAVPLPDVPLIGRATELARLSELSRDNRLVTVVGPGGIGKTSIIKQFLVANPDVVPVRWFVDLTLLTAEQDLSTYVLARILADEAQLDTATLRRALGDTKCFVVLDNCEHRIADAARFVLDLHANCPTARVIATSREPLGLPGETVFALDPLELRELDRDGENTSGQARADALDLFDMFVKAARGGVGLVSAERPAAHALCRQLDAIPLALQLAAGRTRALGIDDVLRSVSRNLAVLGGGSRAIERHRTMEAAIEWSWAGLSPSEQQALGLLSALSAYVRLEAASYVVTGRDDDLEGDRLVTALIDKSLVMPSSNGEGGIRRVRVLWPIASYALAHSSPGTTQLAVERARAWLHQLTDVDELDLQRPEIFERIVQEGDLFAFVVSSSHLAEADRVRLVLSAWICFQYDPLMRPVGIAGLSLADTADGLSAKERGRAFGALGGFYGEIGDAEAAVVAARSSVAIRRELNDPQQLRYGLVGLSHRLVQLGRIAEVAAVVEELYTLVDENEPSSVADIRATDAWLQIKYGNYTSAIQLLESAVAAATAQGMEVAAAMSLANLSNTYRLAGNAEAALQAAKRSFDLTGTRFGPDLQNYAVLALARALLAVGDGTAALAVLDEYPELDDAMTAPRAVQLAAARAEAVSVTAPAAGASYLRDLLTEVITWELESSHVAEVLGAAIRICVQAGQRADAERLMAWHRHLINGCDALPLDRPLVNMVMAMETNASASYHDDVTTLDVPYQEGIGYLLAALDKVIQQA